MVARYVIYLPLLNGIMLSYGLGLHMTVIMLSCSIRRCQDIKEFSTEKQEELIDAGSGLITMQKQRSFSLGCVTREVPAYLIL